MALIIETGYGTPGANAYCTSQFVTDYLTDRGRVTENLWSTVGATVQAANIVSATDYIETRWGPLFRGMRASRLLVGRQASGTLTLTGIPLDTESLTVGLKVYRMVDVLAQENDILIGADEAEMYANIALALEGAGLDETTEEHTLPNYEATGIVQTIPIANLVFLARQSGVNGNEIGLATTITGAVVSGAKFTGGLDQSEQPLSFPRLNLFTRSGQPIYGVPLKIRQATAEYAVRSLAAKLTRDPTVDSRMQPVISTSASVGSLSKSVTYAAGGVYVSQPYPAADRLLAEYANINGGVIRA